MNRSDRRHQVLRLLAADPPPTRREIAEQMNVSHQFVSDLIGELEAVGAVTRQRGKPRTTRAVRGNLKQEPHTL